MFDVWSEGMTEKSVGLGDVPEYILENIVRLACPTTRDVARLACTNRIFRAACNSDVVWEAMLPAFQVYQEILAEAEDFSAPSSACSKKAVYDFLCHRVYLLDKREVHDALSGKTYLQNFQRDFWLDRATGGVCQSVGPQGLHLIWWENFNGKNWELRERQGSRYREVAHLKYCETLEAEGRFYSHLPPGIYTLSWRLCMPERTDLIGPLAFSFEATGNALVTTECSLTPRGATVSSRGRQLSLMELGAGHEVIEREVSAEPHHPPPLGYRWGGDGWMELDVGEFTVESCDSPVEIKFCMKDSNDLALVKFNLYLDCVVIRPSFVIQEVKLKVETAN